MEREGARAVHICSHKAPASPLPSAGSPEGQETAPLPRSADRNMCHRRCTCVLLPPLLLTGEGRWAAPSQCPGWAAGAGLSAARLTLGPQPPWLHCQGEVLQSLPRVQFTPSYQMHVASRLRADSGAAQPQSGADADRSHTAGTEGHRDLLGRGCWQEGLLLRTAEHEWCRRFCLSLCLSVSCSLIVFSS